MSTSPCSISTIEKTILGFTIAIGVFMRVWLLSGMPQINGDECSSSYQAYRAAHGLAFSWMTPDLKVEDPLSLLPVILLHRLFPPSILLTRGVSVFYGLLALPINFFLSRRAFGSPTALVTTLFD